jgi:phosphatidate cytidylyltransferase
MQEFLKRAAVAVLGIPLIVYLTYRGGWFWFAFILIVSTVGQWEFYRMQRNKNIHPQGSTGILVGILILLGIQSEAWLGTSLVLAFGLMLILAVEMWRNDPQAGINSGITILGIIYIPVFLGSLLYLRNHLDHNGLSLAAAAAGFKFTMTVLVSIWIADTFAYIFGTLLGRHKLFVKVSPNKSVEGAVFGFIGSVLVFVLADRTGFLPIGLTKSLIFGITLGIVAQIGDLVESWFKRDSGVKDSSAIFPGQGGMLDIFDGLIYSSPLVLIMTYLLLG